MWAKSAVRDGWKRLPWSAELRIAYDVETKADLGTQDLSEDPAGFGIDPGEWQDVAAKIVDLTPADGPPPPPCAKPIKDREARQTQGGAGEGLELGDALCSLDEGHGGRCE